MWYKNIILFFIFVMFFSVIFSAQYQEMQSGQAYETKLQNSYTVFGLQPGCLQEDVRIAYKRLALIWHPDKWMSQPQQERGQAEQKFKEVNVAHEFLIFHIAINNSINPFGNVHQARQQQPVPRPQPQRSVELTPEQKQRLTSIETGWQEQRIHLNELQQDIDTIMGTTGNTLLFLRRLLSLCKVRDNNLKLDVSLTNLKRELNSEQLVIIKVEPLISLACSVKEVTNKCIADLQTMIPSVERARIAEVEKQVQDINQFYQQAETILSQELEPAFLKMLIYVSGDHAASILADIGQDCEVKKKLKILNVEHKISNSFLKKLEVAVMGAKNLSEQLLVSIDQELECLVDLDHEDKTKLVALQRDELLVRDKQRLIVEAIKSFQSRQKYLQNQHKKIEKRILRLNEIVDIEVSLSQVQLITISFNLEDLQEQVTKIQEKVKEYELLPRVAPEQEVKRCESALLSLEPTIDDIIVKLEQTKAVIFSLGNLSTESFEKRKVEEQQKQLESEVQKLRYNTSFFVIKIDRMQKEVAGKMFENNHGKYVCKDKLGSELEFGKYCSASEYFINYPDKLVDIETDYPKDWARNEFIYTIKEACRFFDIAVVDLRIMCAEFKEIKQVVLNAATKLKQLDESVSQKRALQFEQDNLERALQDVEEDINKSLLGFITFGVVYIKWFESAFDDEAIEKIRKSGLKNAYLQLNALKQRIQFVALLDIFDKEFPALQHSDVQKQRKSLEAAKRLFEQKINKTARQVIDSTPDICELKAWLTEEPLSALLKADGYGYFLKIKELANTLSLSDLEKWQNDLFDQLKNFVNEDFLIDDLKKYIFEFKASVKDLVVMISGESSSGFLSVQLNLLQQEIKKSQQGPVFGSSKVLLSPKIQGYLRIVLQYFTQLVSDAKRALLDEGKQILLNCVDLTIKAIAPEVTSGVPVAMDSVLSHLNQLQLAVEKIPELEMLVAAQYEHTYVASMIKKGFLILQRSPFSLLEKEDCYPLQDVSFFYGKIREILIKTKRALALLLIRNESDLVRKQETLEADMWKLRASMLESQRFEEHWIEDWRADRIIESPLQILYSQDMSQPIKLIDKPRIE